MGELLGSIALRHGGIGVGLYQETVDAHCRAGTRQVADTVIIAHGMAGVKDNRQVGVPLDPRDTAQIQRETRFGLESANTTLTENDLIITATHDEVRAIHKLLQGGAKATLEDDGFATFAGGSEERMVVH